MVAYKVFCSLSCSSVFSMKVHSSALLMDQSGVVPDLPVKGVMTSHWQPPPDTREIAADARSSALNPA